MTKIFILFFLCTKLIFASSTFQWKSTTIAKSVDNPLVQMSSIIEQEMNKVIYRKKAIDLSSAIPDEVAKPILPPEIKTPKLPASIQLVKGEFEKTSAFEKRVLKTSKARDIELKLLQENYRLQVELRNKKVEEISNAYNDKVQKRNKILQRLQEIQKENTLDMNNHYMMMKQKAYDNIAMYSQMAVDKVYGKALVSYKSYNADDEIMYLNLHSSDGENFTKDIEINIPPQKAKALKSALSSVTPSVTFNADVDSEGKISYSIEKISLPYDTQEYVANDVTSEFKFVPTLVTIDAVKTEFNTKNSVIELQKADTQFALQNPNLNDSFALGAIALSENGAIIGNNALVNKIKTIEKTTIDKSKWIFMIAVEEYAETDNVIYAKRSAIAFKKAMQTRFGVDERHTYALLDEQATSGAIKDKLRSLIKNVKEDDTIYFYYSGHGIPAKSGDAYILPQDKIVDFIDKEPFFKLENIYAMLSDSKAKHSFAFIDSCFSGKTDDVLVFKGVAPGLIQTKKAAYDKEKMTIITAGLNDEFSNMYENKKYRLFTYYLTQALIDDTSSVDIFYEKVHVQVAEQSLEMGDRYEQTPQMYGNAKVKLY